MKNYTHIYRLLFWLSSFSFLACEKEATIKVPRVPAKLVLDCVISPQDTFINATISASRPVFGQASGAVTFVQAAIVKISNGSQTVTLPFDVQTFDYRLPINQVFPILPGKTYSIEATALGYPSIKASCTVPLFLPDSNEISVEYSRISSFDERAQVKWRDIPFVKNYYRLGVYEADVDSSIGVPKEFLNRLDQESYDLKQDVNNDGKLLSLYFYRYGNRPKPDYTYVYIQNVDENYYNYASTLVQNNLNNGNPFAEPVLVNSNVENGLGVFGAYQVIRKKVF